MRVLAITDETPDRIALYEQKIIPLRMTVATFRSAAPVGAIGRAAYNGRPTTVIVDRQGHVREMFIGIQTYDPLKKAIARYLRTRYL